MIFHFNSIQIDADTFSLKKNGESQHLEPRVFDLIVYLIVNRDRVLSRDALFDALWEGREVSDATLSNHINSARKVLGDDGDRQVVIKTLRGRGYQFIAELDEQADCLQQDSPIKESNSTAVTVTRPTEVLTPLSKYSIVSVLLIIVITVVFVFVNSGGDVRQKQNIDRWERDGARNYIAVLPFQNRSDLEDDVFFADGIHNDLLTRISKIDGIKTISRTSVMEYRHSTKNSKIIGEELGVNVLLEGGVQRAGNQIRINAQLIDAKYDEHIWAETYTRELSAENIFIIQSEITEAIADQLQIVFNNSDKPNANSPPTQNMAALEAWFNGKTQSNLGTSTGYDKAVDYFQQAIALDSNFAQAHAALAQSYLLQIFHKGLSAKQQTTLAEPHVLRALALDGSESNAYVALGTLRRYQVKFEEAGIAYEKAIELNINNVEAYENYANLLTWDLKDNSPAILLLEQAVALDPKNTALQHTWGTALLMENNTHKAKQVLEALTKAHPEYAPGYRELGAAYSFGYFGEDIAIRTYRKALALDPGNPALYRPLAESYLYLGDGLSFSFWCERYIANAKHIPDEKVYQALYLFVNGDQYAAAKLFSQDSKTSLWAHTSFYFTAKWYANQGDIEAAYSHYATAFPELLLPETKIDSRSFPVAVGFAEFLILRGELELANNLLERASGIALAGKGSKFDFYIESVIHYWLLKGDTEKAITTLHEYAGAGYEMNFLEENFAFPNAVTIYDALKHDAEFIKLLEVFEKRRLGKLENIRQWEKNGNLAEIPAV